MTGDIDWSPIQRPRSSRPRAAQTDGLWKERHDEQPSGLPPTNSPVWFGKLGIFFVLPNEAELRHRAGGERPTRSRRSRSTPRLRPPTEYASRVMQSELRRTMRRSSSSPGRTSGSDATSR